LASSGCAGGQIGAGVNASVSADAVDHDVVRGCALSIYTKLRTSSCASTAAGGIGCNKDTWYKLQKRMQAAAAQRNVGSKLPVNHSSDAWRRADSRWLGNDRYGLSS
jgi:hypothetical protein